MYICIYIIYIIYKYIIRNKYEDLVTILLCKYYIFSFITEAINTAI